MLNKQVLKDQQGTPMGVFIPIQIWESLIFQYPEIETLENEIPRWEKDFINERLVMAQHSPERLQSIEKLFETL